MTSSQRPSGPTEAEQLSSIESARRAAVASTRRPVWWCVGFALTMGLAFGVALLRSPAGWIIAAAIFVLGMVAFLVLDMRLRRRQGRLLKVNSRSTIGFLVVYATAFVLGQIQPPATWQPWFAIAAGVLFAVLSYVYLRWDDADTARRLASGDFDPSDLMP